MYFIVPDWVVYTLLVAAWLGVFYLYILKPFVWPKLDDHFAQRRAMRRMRNWPKPEGHVNYRAPVYDVNSVHPNNVYRPESKKVNKRVPARHRR